MKTLDDTVNYPIRK